MIPYQHAMPAIMKPPTYSYFTFFVFWSTAGQSQVQFIVDLISCQWKESEHIYKGKHEINCMGKNGRRTSYFFHGSIA